MTFNTIASGLKLAFEGVIFLVTIERNQDRDKYNEVRLLEHLWPKLKLQESVIANYNIFILHLPKHNAF